MTVTIKTSIMKKPIKSSQILSGGVFCGLFLLVLGINFLPKVEKQPISISSWGKGKLVLSDSIVELKKTLPNLESISILTQFVDSIELVPAKEGFVEISGDQTLINNLIIQYDEKNQIYYVLRKYFYPVVGIEDKEFYENNFPGMLSKGGLFIKIGYPEGFNQLFSSAEVRKINQQGLLKSGELSINVIAEKSEFNVEANHLHLNITKPEVPFTLDTMDANKHRTMLQKIAQSPMHVVKGKVDLVEVGAYYYGITMLDLSQLKCRQVHADFRYGGKYKKIIAAPTQLFSYITNPKLPNSGIEMICKSKAKVTRAYVVSNRTIRYR
jgi:hypothetical protein